MRTIIFTDPMYLRASGDIVVSTPEGPCNVREGTAEWDMVQAYLLAHPEAVQPEPAPPAPTDEQLKSIANAQRSSLLADYDLAVKRFTRAQFFGQDVTDQLALWHTYARALVLMSSDPEWYKASPILWPEQPEMPTDI